MNLVLVQVQSFWWSTISKISRGHCILCCSLLLQEWNSSELLHGKRETWALFAIDCLKQFSYFNLKDTSWLTFVNHLLVHSCSTMVGQTSVGQVPILLLLATMTKLLLMNMVRDSKSKNVVQHRSTISRILSWSNLLQDYWGNLNTVTSSTCIELLTCARRRCFGGNLVWKDWKKMLRWVSQKIVTSNKIQILKRGRLLKMLNNAGSVLSTTWNKSLCSFLGQQWH